MKKELSFEDKMNRLSSIVEQLENDNIDIDKGIQLYEEGLSLTKELQKLLTAYEDKIESISKEQK